MRSRLLFILRFFLALTLAFIVMKSVFILYNRPQQVISLSDYLSVIAHGLPRDFTMAALLTLAPCLIMGIDLWKRIPRLRSLLIGYEALISLLLSIVLIADCALYSFWGYKLDVTVFYYLRTPKGAIASVSTAYLLTGIACILLLCAFILLILYRITPITNKENDSHRMRQTAGMAVAFLLLLLCVRAGMNRSNAFVYFSNRQFLCHAAVNPAFNLIETTLKAQHYDQFYRFYPEKEANRRFAQLGYSTESIASPQLLTTQRPNIVLIIIEGFGGTFVEPLGGEKGVTPEFNRLTREGIFFTQFYANSYRTDRGVVCTLNGYPSFPTLSVMQEPLKARTLPSLARSLSTVGYDTEFLYGGDITFDRLGSYLLSTGYRRYMSDQSFPSTVRHTHAWGVTDGIVLDTLYRHVGAFHNHRPSFLTCLTLASHAPWAVPYHRIPGNVRTNAMAYTDHCLGRLIARLKQSPQWKNLLVICLPDHGIEYPTGLTEADSRRYHIPMLWLGGAVKAPRHITRLCSQTDLAATLLGQLGIPHRNFAFSRDILSRTYTKPFVLHTFDNGFALIDSVGYTVQDLTSGRLLHGQPTPSAPRVARARLILQKSIDDLAGR